jgi:hypothetical protein
MRQIDVVFNSMKLVSLHRDIQQYLTRPENQEKTLLDALQYVITYKVSAQVRGSPSWWRHRYLDLEAMVSAYGIPTFFLTLTQDDTSDTR